MQNQSEVFDNSAALPSLIFTAFPDSNDELENEITTLAANINAATYRLLELIAEFDRRAAWNGWGIKSCAHWLNARCGIGLPAAREKVRVAKALKGLPKTCEAFALGKLSYSKAREMTRVATPANEGYLLMIAEYGAAHHVAELVRKYRQVERIEARQEANDKAEAQCAERKLNFYWNDEGNLVVTAELAPEQGALFLKSLQSAMEQVDIVEDVPEKMEEDINNSGAASEKYSDERLDEIEQETSKDATAVASLDEKQSISRQAVAQTAVTLNRPAQRADALALMAELAFQVPQIDGEITLKTADRYQVMVHVDAETLVEEPTGPSSTISKPECRHCELEEGPALPPDAVRRLCCDASVLAIHHDSSGNPLNIGRKTRVIPPAMRRALQVRDKGCVFPGCTCTRYVDGHHIKHWADGGETKLNNLVLLCRHHHRLVHEGGFSVALNTNNPDVSKENPLPGTRFIFKRPDSRTIPTSFKPRLLQQVVQSANEHLGLKINAKTSYTQRDNTIDYGMAVNGLLNCKKH